MKKFATKALAGAMALAMVLGGTVIASPKTASAKKVTVKKVTAVSPSGKTAYVAKGKKVSITTTVKVSPNKKANKKVTYKSANSKIATVSSKGVIKGVKAGKTKITVTSKKNAKKKATVKVVVKKAAVKKVTLTPKTASLAVGAKKTLKAKVSPTKNVSSKIAWSTSNKKVATVTSKGVVKGIKEGTATITAKAADGSGKKATCKVTVGAGIASVSVLNSRLVRVTLTSAKKLAVSNFVVQCKTTPSGKYNTAKALESVRTTDNKTYDVLLDNDNTIGSDTYVLVTISALASGKTKEVYVTNVPDYSDEYETAETIQYVTGTVGDTYDSYWYESVPTAGYTKRSVTGLPAGLKAYTSKQGTSVRVAGTFTSEQNGTTATLTAVDETGKTVTKKYVFYIGGEKSLVGTVITRDQLAYVADDPNTAEYDASGLNIGTYVSDINDSYYYDDDSYFEKNGTRIIVGGGSGSYRLKLTGIPAELGEYKTDDEGDEWFSVKTDASGRTASVPANTYKFTVTVEDRNDTNVRGAMTYDLKLVDGVTFTGTVKDAAGVPAKYVYIGGQTKKDAYGRDVSLGTTTKADGTYKTRVLPGDYELYTSVHDVQSNVSVGNVFTAGNAVKDFVIPQYLVNFTTNISGAQAYSRQGSLVLIDSYGNNSYIYTDSDVDYSMYAYLRAGSYEFAAAGKNSSRNTVRAYSKYVKDPDSTDPSLSSSDYLGTFRLSGSFNVSGNGTVALNAEKVADDYE